MNTSPLIDPALAVRLAPTRNGLDLLLRAITKHGDRTMADRVSRNLRTVAELLDNTTARVVFGGHFSCGKSTLINALIGRPLLPISDYPETGVPCELRADGANRVELVMVDGTRTALPFDADAIAAQIRLIGDDGRLRTAVRRASTVHIGLAGDLPPAGTSWTDSPGINDTVEMAERAKQTAAEADLLVWVVNSRQPFAETEQEFLRAHVATHGPGSVVFVVNVFLSADGAADWNRFLASGLPHVRNRIDDADLTEPLQPVVVPASALGIVKTTTQFGGPEVIAALAAARPRMALTRLHRATRQLTELSDYVGQAARAEQQRVQTGVDNRTAATRAAEKRRTDFNRLAQAGLTARFADYTSRMEQVASPICADVVNKPLVRDDTYEDALNAAMAATAAALADAVIADANREAGALRLGSLTPRTATALRELLRPDWVSIEVPYTGGAARRATLGAVVGGIVGSLLPGPGTIIGAGLGATIAGSTSNGTARDRSLTTSALNAAAQEAASTLAARRQAASTLLLESAALPQAALPDPPDREHLRTLTKLHSHLTDTLIPALEAARRSALAEANP